MKLITYFLLFIFFVSHSVMACNPHMDEVTEEKKVLSYTSFADINAAEDTSLQLLTISSEQAIINQQARHLIRPILWERCLEKIRAKADEKYPQPQQGKDIQWKERAIYLLNEKGSLKTRLLSFASSFMLNEDIIKCLKGKSPSIFKDTEVFKGLRKTLENNGFYLNESSVLCKRDINNTD